MSDVADGTEETTPEVAWYAIDGDTAINDLSTDRQNGLAVEAAAALFATLGPNQLHAEPPPSKLTVALVQVRDPMNLMLMAVAVISIAIGQASTGVLVALLVTLNVVLGTRQEMAARASVDALANLQTPETRVIRGGVLESRSATDLVPGDIIQLEAGDIVPADGRILRSATLEVQEAALTGESLAIAKDTAVIPDQDTALGDRINMVFQNTSVTRGTATVVVTATGMHTEMGRIAAMLTSVERTRSPLQQELDSLTKVLGIIAWTAVAVIVGIGLARGLEFDQVLLLGTAMAVSAIPTGLPTFVQGMLSYGAKQLAEAKAVVTNLTDVETLGSTSAINTDKTGTLTLNEMQVRHVFYEGGWYKVDGEGYAKTGSILGIAGETMPNFSALAYGLALDSDATVSDDGKVIGDPTEAALVVLAAKAGVDAEETRRRFPREAEVPFDSAYKFMATVHRLPLQDGSDGDGVFLLVKGAPDIVLGRSSTFRTAHGGTVSMDEMRHEVVAANERMASQGLRVLSFAAKRVSADVADAVIADPMAHVNDLQFVGLVGIVDPLRPSAIDAVAAAHDAGVDVRMITGDHVVTATAIGEELGLGRGGISGTEFRAMSDEDVLAALPNLHVFGRVAPEDKLRLVQLMQSEGLVVAMTGDAVNDAAALKQADIGVAMGSGSEVTKQAAKMILTDDNFGTLVHAIELGRSIYEKVALYVRYQMSQLLALVLLFLAASVFNINAGVALTPSMVLWLNFFVASFPVIVILLEPVHEGLMDRPPRDRTHTLANRREVWRWLLYGSVLFAATSVPLLYGPDALSVDSASVSMTMAYVVMAFGTILTGLAVRRDPNPGLSTPLLKPLQILAVPVVLTFLTTELPFFQTFLTTTALNATEWAASIALASIVFIAIEIEKWVRRSRTDAADTTVGERASTPAI
jgi:Ca2+-transporting ATPase